MFQSPGKAIFPILNRCLQGFPANPHPLSPEQTELWAVDPARVTSSAFLEEHCAEACRKLAETLWQRVYGATGTPASEEWLAMVSTRIRAGLGNQPQYLSRVWHGESDETGYWTDLPFWEPEHYGDYRNLWDEQLAVMRMKRDYRIQMDGVEQLASPADMPTVRELDEITIWYGQLVAGSNLNRKTSAERLVDAQLKAEYGATPENRSWYNEES